MRVDHHLLRRMLEAIEEAAEPELRLMPELTTDAAAQRRHLQLLIDGGYVTAKQLRPHGNPCSVGLTLAGQDLLDELRRKKTKQAKVWLERLLAVSVVRLLFGAG